MDAALYEPVEKVKQAIAKLAPKGKFWRVEDVPWRRARHARQEGHARQAWRRTKKGARPAVLDERSLSHFVPEVGDERLVYTDEITFFDRTAATGHRQETAWSRRIKRVRESA